jgi:hypothetical protein
LDRPSNSLSALKGFYREEKLYGMSIVPQQLVSVDTLLLGVAGKVMIPHPEDNEISAFATLPYKGTFPHFGKSFLSLSVPVASAMSCK